MLLTILVLVADTSRGAIDTPDADPRAPVSVRAESSNRWREGSYEVWHLRGNCEVRQADLSARADEAVLWIDRGEPFSGEPDHVIAYFEGSVSVERLRDGNRHIATGRQADSMVAEHWLARFNTFVGVQAQMPLAGVAPRVPPPAYQRGVEARQSEMRGLTSPRYNVRQAQFEALPPATQATTRGPRRLTVTPRSSAPVQAKTYNVPERNEQIAVIDQGVRMMIEGVEEAGFGGTGKVDVEADRVVIWAGGMENLDLLGQQSQNGDRPLEVYMEGNIVFRQGDRVIYAERMYYDAANDAGTILNAEILTPVQEYSGLLRLKADVVQQLNEQNFLAYGAAVTSSRLGVPRYWFQGQNVSFQDVQTPVTDFFSGQPLIDPVTGEQAVNHQMLATSRNNFVYVAGLPVFYWPVLATDLKKPSYYINQVGVRNDSIFGTQALLDLDAYQLLGISNRPTGTDWELSLDYFSNRGPAVGTNYSWNRDDIFGIPGPAFGFFDFWGIHDTGLDTLGADRLALVPSTTQRGRILGRHRQDLPGGLQFTGQLGLISDNNFLEQYFEREWDELKDQTTDVLLRQSIDNWSWNILAEMRPNDFFTQTEWLPRADHFILGQSLLADRLSWYGHSHVGYARLRTAVPPTDPVDAAKFLPMAWEVNSEGIRVGTRQELDLPIEVGPAKVVPYVLGDATHWGEDLTGTSVTRLLGQIGVRSRLPMWRADREVQSTLLNLNGLAHKVVFSSDFFYADADQDLSRFPLYDPLDDNSTEFFRRKYPFDDFAGMPIPLRFDERYYALRSGMQSWVTAPSAEIADDLLVSRMGVHQRWQTKRGLPGQQHIVDWIVLDLEGSFFQNADRDNFGEEVGLLNYDFRWHVGDRLTMLSDGFFDVFSQGLKTVSVGGILTQPEYGSLYLGFRSLEGPIASNILSGAVNYRMSEKWIATAGTAVDFASTGNIGQSIAFTRVGESALLRVGFNADVLRRNVGVVFSIEPRFLPVTGLGNVGGVFIPPAGAEGLE
ncbi:MAG: organic solvent tolerance protein OstA [Pirellulaceae bacterium]